MAELDKTFVFDGLEYHGRIVNHIKDDGTCEELMMAEEPLGDRVCYMFDVPPEDPDNIDKEEQQLFEEASKIDEQIYAYVPEKILTKNDVFVLAWCRENGIDIDGTAREETLEKLLYPWEINEPFDNDRLKSPNCFLHYILTLDDLKNLFESDAQILQQASKTDDIYKLDVTIAYDMKENKIFDFYARYKKGENLYTASVGVIGTIHSGKAGFEDGAQKSIENVLCNVLETEYRDFLNIEYTNRLSKLDNISNTTSASVVLENIEDICSYIMNNSNFSNIVKYQKLFDVALKVTHNKNITGSSSGIKNIYTPASKFLDEYLKNCENGIFSDYISMLDKSIPESNELAKNSILYFANETISKFPEGAKAIINLKFKELGSTNEDNFVAAIQKELGLINPSKYPQFVQRNKSKEKKEEYNRSR